MTRQGTFRRRLRKEFEACRSIVTEKRNEISLRGVRKMLAERLEAPQLDVDDEKELVARLVDEALRDRAEFVEMDSSLAQAIAKTCLPPEIWIMVFQKLDLSSAIAAMQVCKSFQQTIASSNAYWDRLTGQLMTARFLAPSGYFTNSTFSSFHRLVHDLVLCRDCGAFADWPASQKICKPCCQGYEAVREGQRFMTKDTARFVYKLRDQDLPALKHLRAQNPIYPQFQPMQLYEKVAVRRVAIERWGSIEGMLRHMRPMRALPKEDASSLGSWSAS